MTLSQFLLVCFAGWINHHRIQDARVPEPEEILAALHGNDCLEGSIADFTDSGDKSAAFAMVEFEQPVVVPTEALKRTVEGRG